MRRPLNITLTRADHRTLERWVRFRALPVGQVERARIVLGAAVGRTDKDLAAELDCSRQRCARTRRRFQDGGLAAVLGDAPRPGRPRRHDHSRIVELTNQSQSASAIGWSTRLMARRCGVSASTVGRVWRAHGLKPQLTRTNVR